MKGFFLTIIFVFLAIAGVLYYYNGASLGLSQTILSKPTIVVSSQEFLNSGSIPIKYSCDGDNINPPITIDRVPGDAKSLVLIVEDIDVQRSPFTHWLVFNIDPTITNINENEIPNALEGTNDFNELNYKGPCPPTGSHKYYFRIFALDKTLDLQEGAKRTQIDAAMKGHIIGRGEVWGRYSKN